MKEQKRDVIQRTGKNYILAIAVDEYKHFSNLDNAVSDLDGLLKLFKSKFQFEDDHISTLFNHEATEANIEKELKRFGDFVTPIDNVIIIFAGHGNDLGSNKNSFWAAFDTEKAYESGIHKEKILNYIERINSLHTLFIIDSCFGVGFLKPSKPKKRKTVNSKLYNISSRWVISAGGFEEVSDGKNISPFMEALLTCLHHQNNDSLRISKMIVNLTDLTYQNAKGNQIPVGNPLDIEGHKGGEFVFHLKKTEEEFWLEAMKENTIQAFGYYLSLFPKGNYQHHAIIAIEKLEYINPIQKIKTFIFPLMYIMLGIVISSIITQEKSDQNNTNPQSKIYLNDHTNIWKEKIDDRWLLSNGDYSTEDSFGEIVSVGEDRILVKTNGLYGYVDTSSLSTAIFCKYNYASSFEMGKALVGYEGEFFLINHLGNEIESEMIHSSQGNEEQSFVPTITHVGLIELKNQIKNLATVDIKKSLQMFKKNLHKDSTKYDSIIRLLNRYQTIETKFRDESISFESFTTSKNKIIESFLDLVNGIENTDLKHNVSNKH